MTITGLRRADHDSHDDAVLGSVGHARSGVEVAVRGTDGASAPAGEVGEIVCRGDVVMSGYWNNPRATADTLRDGWLHTGDLGSFDDRGYLGAVARIGAADHGEGATAVLERGDAGLGIRVCGCAAHLDPVAEHAVVAVGRHLTRPPSVVGGRGTGLAGTAEDARAGQQRDECARGALRGSGG